MRLMPPITLSAWCLSVGRRMPLLLLLASQTVYAADMQKGLSNRAPPPPLHLLPVLRLMPAASQITFLARQTGVPMEGRFKRFDAQLRLDPKQPEGGQVEVRVDMASASLGADGESLLQDAAWFNTANFPQAVFVSRQIKSVAPGKLAVAGVFTLKGVSQALTVLVTLAASGDHWMATGRFILPRLAYHVGNGDWADTTVIANDVQVDFSWQLQGVKPKK